MSGQVIAVLQTEGEIVVTFPGRKRVPLEVTDGRVTVHDDDIAQAVLDSVPGAHRVDEPASDYNPAEYTVTEVNAYLDKHPDEAPAVLGKEAGDDGRGRRGIVEGPHAAAAPEPEDEEPAGPPAEQE